VLQDLILLDLAEEVPEVIAQDFLRPLMVAVVEEDMVKQEKMVVLVEVVVLPKVVVNLVDLLLTHPVLQEIMVLLEDKLQQGIMHLVEVIWEVAAEAQAKLGVIPVQDLVEMVVPEETGSHSLFSLHRLLHRQFQHQSELLGLVL
jgi:hypothetical protein